jgi:hypothetical protein
MKPSNDDTVIGKKIVHIRQMTQEEMNEEGWVFADAGDTVVLVLSDGTILYPSADWEGNGPGVIFGKQNNQGIYINIPKSS